MMYNSKMASAIKVRGQILREQGESVAIPLGSEYSIFIKNLNSVRALVDVSIDGESVTGGRKLIVQPNSYIDLERFIRDGNLETGNKFKFIERTEKIENGPRGARVDDGLVRIEYQFEMIYQLNSYQPGGILNTSIFDQKLGNLRTAGDYRALYSSTDNVAFASAGSAGAAASLSSEQLAIAQNAIAGITVSGGQSTQKFTQGSTFPTESMKHVMILRLVGQAGGQPVLEPITVKQKPKCETCGTQNKATAKFCSHCGTSLIKY